MKRLSIALAAIGLSVGAFAALPAATDPTLVAVPQFPGGSFIGGSGLYLEPAAAGNDLAYGFHNRYVKVDPGYSWGWSINGGYLYPGTANDVYISYFQLNTSDTASTAFAPVISSLFSLTGGAIGATTFTLQNPNQGLAPTAISFAHANAEYGINQVELDAGQYIDVGCRLTLHPSVGLRWADVDRKLSTDATENFAAFSVASTDSAGAPNIVSFAPGANLYHTEEESDFSGIGPEIGIDSTYYVGYGFGFIARAEAALLIGTIDTENNFESTINNAVVPGGNISLVPAVLAASDWSEPSTTRIVPVADLKLGANYTYLFNNALNSDLTLEAGWQVSEYRNSVDRTFATGAPAAGGSLGVIANVNGFPSTTSGVGFQGPYVNLTFHA